MIFDNYDDPDAYDVERHHPVATHGSIVITTRLPSRVGSDYILVEPLQKIEDSLTVLQTRSKRANVTLGEGILQGCKRRETLTAM